MPHPFYNFFVSLAGSGRPRGQRIGPGTWAGLRASWAGLWHHYVKVSEFVFRVFCLILTICPVTQYGPFSMILDSFGYLHTPRRCSTKPFTKRLSRCGGKVICISCFLPYTHHLPSHSVWSVFYDLRLVRIPSHSIKMLHRTIYETVEPLWR